MSPKRTIQLLNMPNTYCTTDMKVWGQYLYLRDKCTVNKVYFTFCSSIKWVVNTKNQI